MTTTSNDDDRLSHRRVQLYRSDATVPCRRIVANSLRDSIAERCIRQCHISSVCLTVCLSHSSVMFNEKGWTRNRTAFTILFFCNSSVIEKKQRNSFGSALLLMRPVETGRWDKFAIFHNRKNTWNAAACLEFSFGDAHKAPFFLITDQYIATNIQSVRVFVGNSFRCLRATSCPNRTLFDEFIEKIKGGFFSTSQCISAASVRLRVVFGLAIWSNFAALASKSTAFRFSWPYIYAKWPR